jgi:UDP-N-acetylmuramoyl-tripeptide--D-alanyl-D-alanine ligase
VREEAQGLTVLVGGVETGHAVTGARPGNVACAVAVALELGVAPEEVAARVATLPAAAHRLEAGTGAGGVVVLDDTYNANPAGTRSALATLAKMAAPSARRVVVTPGMVELGRVQVEENTRFAREVASVANDLVVVGRTNRRALLAGAVRPDGAGPPLGCVVVARRDQAVAWVRDHLRAGDIVLYENDLPDHYP